MKIKNIILASALLASLPTAVKAQDAPSYDNYRVSCETGAECNDFDVVYEQAEGNDEVAQRTRPRRRTRRTRSDDSKIYAGGTLGVFFPSDVDDTIIEPDTGFGGSIYGGYKITDLISADAELLLAFGGNDVEDTIDGDLDGSYTLFSFFLNPRFTYSFNQNSERSPYVFASPGLGVGSFSLGDDVGDAIEDTGGENSGSGFAIQGKVGVGYPVTDSIDIIGQARYLNIFNVVEVGEVNELGEVETDDEGISAFGIEIGANFKF